MEEVRHHWVVRVTHATGAAAMICMMLSGWAIYNASPILPFVFPRGVTLGGWLAGGIAWHLAAMWVLIASGVVYLVFGFASGHFRRDFWPIGWAAVRRDLGAALQFKLAHGGVYNAVQRVFYVIVLLAASLAVLSGFAIWKPVQLGWITWLLGGYDVARRVHFACMVVIAAFLVVHLALVAIVPRTLPGMIFGRVRRA